MGTGTGLGLSGCLLLFSMQRAKGTVPLPTGASPHFLSSHVRIN